MNTSEYVQEHLLIQLAKSFMLIMLNEHPRLYKKVLNKAAKLNGTTIHWTKPRRRKRK